MSQAFTCAMESDNIFLYFLRYQTVIISGIRWSVESSWNLVFGRKKESSWSDGDIQDEEWFLCSFI